MLGDFQTVKLGVPVEIKTAGAVPGEEAEFLWVNDNVGAAAPEGGDYQPMDRSSGENLMSSGSQSDCAGHGFINIYQTRVRIPRTADLATKVAVLTVSGLDEGMKVQVDGHLVGYLNQSDVKSDGTARLQLVGNVSPLTSSDGSYLVQLTSLNSCGKDSGNLRVSIAMVDRRKADADEFGETPPPSGCSMSTARSTTLASGLLIALAIAIAVRRTRRMLQY
jgi:hypothetical protein